MTVKKYPITDEPIQIYGLTDDEIEGKVIPRLGTGYWINWLTDEQLQALRDDLDALPKVKVDPDMPCQLGSFVLKGGE